MTSALRELYRYRELLMMITYRDIRVKYKQSVMGLLWAVLMPAMVVLAGVTVKYAYAMATQQPLVMADIASVAVKSIPWAFLVGSIRFSSLSLISNTNLVTKVYFPKEVFPFAAVASQFFDLLIASAVLALFLVVVDTGMSWQLLWTPVLLAILVLQAVGIGTLVAAGSLFFRDVKYLVELVLTFAIFFTPVLYDADLFGASREILFLNPVAPVIEGFRSVIILHRAPDLLWILYSSSIAAVACVGSYVLFKSLEPRFAETV